MNQEWKPMEIAPKDGTPILVWDGQDISLVEWRAYRLNYPGCKNTWAWCLPDSDQDEQGGCATIDNPVCWMLLPAAPEREPSGEGNAHGQ